MTQDFLERVIFSKVVDTRKYRYHCNYTTTDGLKWDGYVIYREKIANIGKGLPKEFVRKGEFLQYA